jgi:hypothetical protein
VKSYYASIDHLMLLDRLAISIPGTEAAVIRHFQKLMCCSCRRRMPAQPLNTYGGLLRFLPGDAHR